MRTAGQSRRIRGGTGIEVYVGFGVAAPAALQTVHDTDSFSPVGRPYAIAPEMAQNGAKTNRMTLL
jgi:hypothetical protein